jgi:hypothetical protein
MTLDTNEIEQEALKLSPALRTRLASRLLSSLETLSDTEIEALWIEEALRRDREMETIS